MTDGLTVLALSELEGEILDYADKACEMVSDGCDGNSIYEYIDNLAWTIMRRYDELFSEAYLMGKRDTIEQYEKDYPEKARNEECFVYFITDGDYLKIGVSKDVERRKFIEGEPITDLPELLQQEWVMWYHQTKHIEVIKSTQLRSVLRWLEMGAFRKAIRKESEEK